MVLFAEAQPARLSPLLAEFRGIDLVVAGREPSSRPQPITLGGVPVIALGNQGKYVAELRIHRKNGRPAITPVRPLAGRAVPRGSRAVPVHRDRARFDQRADAAGRPKRTRHLTRRSRPTWEREVRSGATRRITRSGNRPGTPRPRRLLVRLKRDFSPRLRLLPCHGIRQRRGHIREPARDARAGQRAVREVPRSRRGPPRGPDRALRQGGRGRAAGCATPPRPIRRSTSRSAGRSSPTESAERSASSAGRSRPAAGFGATHRDGAAVEPSPGRQSPPEGQGSAAAPPSR